MKTAQQIITDAKAARGMYTGPRVGLYAGDLCAENLPAEFSEVPTFQEPTYVGSEKIIEYFTCELLSVEVGHEVMDRAAIVRMIGEPSVRDLELAREAELLEDVR